MPKPDTLLIIHYHLLPGGVCSAIKNSLLALADSGWLSQRSLRLLIGRKDGAAAFKRSLDRLGLQILIQVDSRLDYRERRWPDPDDFWREATDLGSWFLEQARGVSLYWAHNPTLGKNPLVTAALMTAERQSAATGAPHRFLHHIHDFPECGRLWNLVNLRTCWGSGGLDDFYPGYGNLGYAVLNSADAQRLVQAGIPKDRIARIPNAVVPVEVKPRKSKREIALALQRYAGENGYRFEPGRPWWTLPVRLIRRKNAVEALILAAIAEDPPQLLVTLDANSNPERPYAEAVKDLFRREDHAAVVGFGHELVGSAFNFDDLLLASEAVVTTSLLEGFGFAFLEGANRGRPLVGRNLSDVTTDFLLAGFPSPSLYSDILVPVSRATRETLINRGRGYALKNGLLLGLSQSRINAFVAAVETVFADDVADFGFLDLAHQIEVALRLQDDSFVRDLQELNPGAAEPALFPGDFSERIQEQFGLQPHAVRLAECFDTLFSRNWEETASGNVSDRLLELYFVPRFHRPLTGEW